MVEGVFIFVISAMAVVGGLLLVAALVAMVSSSNKH
jgi:hypothetical protein